MSTGDPICFTCGNYKLQCVCGKIVHEAISRTMKKGTYLIGDMDTKDKLTEKLNEAKMELIAWLNDECPACFPPLEPYTTADLSHDFAEKLRERLDNIIILKVQLYEFAK